MREQYEWCNIWWNNANDADLPRALLIGDSIAVGYSPIVTNLLAGKVNVDRLGTSKGIDDDALIRETSYVLEEYRYAAVHFNNGLHGWHLSDDDYESSLRKYTRTLRELSKGAALIWACSTPITMDGETGVLHPKLNTQVVSRNAIAARVMKEYGIPVNDLYKLVVGKADLHAADGYHYNEDGNKLMGEAVAGMVAKALGIKL